MGKQDLLHPTGKTRRFRAVLHHAIWMRGIAVGCLTLGCSSTPFTGAAADGGAGDGGENVGGSDSGNAGASGNTGGSNNAGASGDTGTSGTAGDEGNTGGTAGSGTGGASGASGGTAGSGNAGGTSGSGMSGSSGDPCPAGGYTNCATDCRPQDSSCGRYSPEGCMKGPGVSYGQVRLPSSSNTCTVCSGARAEVQLQFGFVGYYRVTVSPPWSLTQFPEELCTASEQCVIMQPTMAYPTLYAVTSDLSAPARNLVAESVPVGTTCP